MFSYIFIYLLIDFIFTFSVSAPHFFFKKNQVLYLKYVIFDRILFSMISS